MWAMIRSWSPSEFAGLCIYTQSLWSLLLTKQLAKTICWWPKLGCPLHKDQMTWKRLEALVPTSCLLCLCGLNGGSDRVLKVKFQNAPFEFRINYLPFILKAATRAVGEVQRGNGKAGAFVTSYKCWCLNWGGGRNRAVLVSKSGEWRFHLSKCLHVTIKEGVGLHGASCRSCRTLGFRFLLFHFPLPSSAELILFKCV